MKKPVAVLVSLACLLLLSGCNPLGERTVYSVGYYTIDGKDIDELHQQIQVHGPKVTGVGNALAAADITMVPSIKYELRDGLCHISSAKVHVNARVTLPRHSNKKVLERKLARTWNNLAEYAKVHEAVHLEIADRHALEMERTIASLQPRSNCATMRETVSKVFEVLYRRHHIEQLRFDQTERERIRVLAQE